MEDTNNTDLIDKKSISNNDLQGSDQSSSKNI